ncbi:MFS transporter [Edwardsiella ictaluri]|uniref:Transporter, major facilitator family n=1 Tax=Edwardsiella ictaluri (strain 93-146) TaxID=634503 RepID=C5B705_EDWI9|nr:OFA family MFS transporter [Edwardsiella ictaluri]ACR67467.1 transporter, major facilitator family [Edwardsiella ictaluri 93-146]AVZ82036.1 MFS transporter [Edwardsiella ictaluri]EKS7763409.1 OFA family MFS transporter [Edwardsiella ictaluri]EKS7770229.1 OFA family MFS transporter [Edwardsiella ictaluri]EKS7773370.1 OFA family MFS transporter [Edwardsiella ictaluri]
MSVDNSVPTPRGDERRAADVRPGFFSKARIIARPGFNRWLVPPAALAIHLCIGMAYGFSVFWLPLSQALGGGAAQACPAQMSAWQELFTTRCDWRISMLGWTYTLFFIFLGCSAALWGSWLEKAGPRKVGVVAACCWCGGLMFSALGVYLHQLWMLWLGSGVIGGIGLGLGYISPVSTLIRWFPDRRGMATGLAIMGFGGGAMVGAPLANSLMHFYTAAGGVGVWQTFLTLALIYWVFMLAGALAYRIPPIGWRPQGMAAATETPAAQGFTHVEVHVSVACRTPQFWLLWAVLCLNVSAGIGIIGMASPLLQEVFAGRLLGGTQSFAELSSAQLAQIAAIAAGFTGLLSLFNIGGRFFWASLSDRIGRNRTFFLFFALGMVLYGLLPTLGALGSVTLFALAFCLIVSMYGGGFATVPAYLADLFGTQMVGAIHGRLLTAWSAAGILGPVLVNYLREYQLSRGIARAQAYSETLYILAGLLLVGLVCNLLIRPVDRRHTMSEAQLAQARSLYKVDPNAQLSWSADAGSRLWVALSWLAVGLPLLWGCWITLLQAGQLFG